jgi:hypothetical protein
LKNFQNGKISFFKFRYKKYIEVRIGRHFRDLWSKWFWKNKVIDVLFILKSILIEKAKRRNKQ